MEVGTMRNGMLWCSGILLLAAGSLTALSLTWGQEPSAPPVKSPPATPPTFPLKLTPAQLGPDLSKLPFAQQQMYLAAKAGKEWMVRLNGADGRFLYGLVPSLRVTLAEDNYSHQ